MPTDLFQLNKSLTKLGLDKVSFLTLLYTFPFIYSSFLLCVHLFQLLGAEMHIFIKAEGFYAFGSAQNATFSKKLRFGPRQKTRSERANLMELRRSIKQKSPMHI